MDDFLEALYCCDIRFAPNRQIEQKSAAALDDIIREEAALRAELSPEHWALVESYWGKVEDYHTLYAQAEFERGFLFGSRLMLEISSKNEKSNDISEI